MKREIMTAVLALSVSAYAQGDNKAAPGKAVAAAKEGKTAEPAKAPEAPPAAAKELSDAMAPLEGDFKCTGKMIDSPMGPGHALEATWSMKKELNGYWFVAKFDEKKTKVSPMPYAMSSTVGWDAGKKQLARADFDNFGQVTHAMSKGWEGDKLVFEGKVTGEMPMSFRETTTKKAKEFTTSFEFAMVDNKWFPAGEYTCKK